MKPVPVAELRQLADEAWDAELEASGAAYRFSHRAAAGHAFEAAFPEYRFEPYRVTYRDGAVALVPLVRARRRLAALTTMLGMPLGLEGTPVLLDGALGAGHVRGLFDALDDCGRLTLHGGAGGSPPANGAGTVLTTHILDLSPGFEALWSNAFSPKNRNKVRKAEKLGIEVADETSEGGADTYYEIYAAASEKWGYATPPYPRSLIDALLSSGEAELWIARQDGEAMAGSILLRGSSDLLSWSTATRPGKQELAPNNAIVSAALESACARGVGYFDFGGSTDLPGVERFKASFGAQARDYAVAEVRSLRCRALERLRR